MPARNLCTIDDVHRYIPGYVPNETTDGQLQASITAESESIHDETGRLIVPFTEEPETRSYGIDTDAARVQRVDIDDLATVDITVELQAGDGTSLGTLGPAKIRPLYDSGRRQQLRPWEPIVQLEFPIALGAPALTCGQTLLVTGTFGFPQIPPFIVEACAKRVILRYASDVAAAGTQLAAAIAEVNLAGLFASSRDDVARLNRMVMIA